MHAAVCDAALTDFGIGSRSDNLIPQMTIDLLKSRRVLCVVWCIVVYTQPLKRAFQLKPSMK
jgi:hypothetical protein